MRRPPVDGWDCTSCAIARVEPHTGRVVATVPVASGSAGVRVGAGSVWVCGEGDGAVTRIDPASGASTRIRTDASGAGTDIAVGGGADWVRGISARVLWFSAQDPGATWRVPPEAT